MRKPRRNPEYMQIGQEASGYTLISVEDCDPPKYSYSLRKHRMWSFRKTDGGMFQIAIEANRGISERAIREHAMGDAMREAEVRLSQEYARMC